MSTIAWPATRRFWFRIRWYAGLAVGVAYYRDCFYVQLGPVQIEWGSRRVVPEAD